MVDETGCSMPTRSATSATDATEAPAEVNEVQLRGRVSGEPQERELPSGDTVVQLRVVVRRPERTRTRGHTTTSPATAPGRGQGVTVDTIDVGCWTAATRRAAGRLLEGDVVEVSGSLRRRFWRSPSGAASRYEVEASSVRRVSKSTPRST